MDEISNINLKPLWLGLDGPWLLILGSVVLLLVSAGLIYWKFTQPKRPTWRSIWREYWPVIVSFLVLAAVAALLGWAVDLLHDGSTRAIALQGVFTSLLDDLLFFSLLGFMLILVQRREADRGRNIDDKIDLLFDAKKLRSGEVGYLKDQVRTISADCRSNSTSIDVIVHDAANHLVQIDVSRRFTVGNYLATETAQYHFQQGLTPDDACGNEPCLKVFPSVTTSLLPDGRDGYDSTEDEILDPGGDFKAGEKYSVPAKTLGIEPAQLREFRTRFRAWQRLVPETNTGLEEKRTASGEPEAYRVQLLKHWDEISIVVRNSLSDRIRVSISGRDVRTFDLHPGDQQHKAYRVENLSPDSKIYVAFAVLKEPVNLTTAMKGGGLEEENDARN